MLFPSCICVCTYVQMWWCTCVQVHLSMCIWRLTTASDTVLQELSTWICTRDLSLESEAQWLTRHSGRQELNLLDFSSTEQELQGYATRLGFFTWMLETENRTPHLHAKHSTDCATSTAHLPFCLHNCGCSLYRCWEGEDTPGLGIWRSLV